MTAWRRPSGLRHPARAAVTRLRRRSLLLASAVLILPGLWDAHGETAVLRLATQDTAIAVEAAPAGPRVLSLRTPGGFAWQGTAPERLIDRVMVDGQWASVRWRLKSRDEDQNHVALIYESSEPKLRLEWEWRARAREGPLEHFIRIRNLTGREIELPLQTSFSFDWAVPASRKLHELWIEKGAGTPSPAGTHDVPLTDHFHWTGASSTYARDPGPGGEWEPIPWMLVQTADGKPEGWYLGIEFSGRARLTLAREGQSLSGDAGLNPDPGPFLTRLPAGSTFETPTIFLGAFAGGADAAGNILRRWERRALLNPLTLTNPAYPVLTNNSWGSGMEIDEPKAHRMIEDSAVLGLEMFHLDAGWFRGVADWTANPAKFPHGIGALADYAHKLGLKFGLWVDWTQAGTATEPGALNVHEAATRDWLTRDVAADWKPEPFKGLTIDLGFPPAREWCRRELHRIVGDYHLDMLEHDGYLLASGCTRADHPHVACAPANAGPPPWLDGPCSTDVSRYSVAAYYELYAELRRDFPNLLLEACNDGGRMVDFGTAAHVDYYSITDTYDPLSNRRAFYDASFLLPPSMLECYVEKIPASDAASFLHMLRSGMMGWLTIMQDTTAWTAEQHAAAGRAIQTYKTRLRPLIREADLYHVSPRPDGVHWDGIEYFARDSGRGVLFAFRGSAAGESSHAFPLPGLRADRRYSLEFEDHSLPNRIETGRDLSTRGLKVVLPAPNSSELVFFKELPR